MIAKHASDDSYHWVLVLGRVHATPENLARLLAVAYMDEASGLLGRGDPRWSVPRAYLRRSGALEADAPGEGADAAPAPSVRDELHRIATWLRRRHRAYLADLRDALRGGAPDGRFRELGAEEADDRGILDPTGRGIVAPDPPPVVTRTRPTSDGEGLQEEGRLPWRRRSLERG